MTELTLRKAQETDLPLLARMNKHLIEDEGSPNPMDLAQLEERMRGWLLSDWHIDLLCRGAEVVGYAVYRFRPDEYFPDREEVYLRQYFIRREFRRNGFGQTGIRLLMERRFKPGQTVIIDVLDGNMPGKSFWAKVGFKPYSITMKTHNAARA